MEDKTENLQIPEIGETEEEKGLSITALKRRYTTLARSRFIHNPPMAVLNKDTNWFIELSNRVINEWWGKSRTRERIISIQLLDAMIEGAKFLSTTEDNKKTPGIESVSYFENFCKINGGIFKINITVKKMKSKVAKIKGSVPQSDILEQPQLSEKNRYFAYYFAAVKA